MDIQTTLNQLTHSDCGVDRLCAMTGASGFIDHGNAVSFKFKGSSAANFCKVTLEGDDTYTVLLGRIRKFEVTGKRQFEGVYAHALKGTFESATGLHLSL